MKYVTLASFNNNAGEWIYRMEMELINIELKIPGDYEYDQFLVEVYEGALLAKCKTFKNEIQSQKQKCLIGTLPNSGRIDTNNSMIHIYYNIIEDGTWKKYLVTTDQISALTTLVHEVCARIRCMFWPFWCWMFVFGELFFDVSWHRNF